MLSLFLLALSGLTSAKKFYTSLQADGTYYYNKLTKNSSVTFIENTLYNDYYEIVVDKSTSHININVTWDTDQWLSDGHPAEGAMFLYAAKDSFPAPGMHWDWSDHVSYQSGGATAKVNCMNLIPQSRLLIAVSGKKGAVYKISANTVTGIYSPPIELEMNKRYELCDVHANDNDGWCEFLPNQYSQYYVQTDLSCQYKEDCCYGVMVNGEFQPADGFRLYVNPDDVPASRTHHKYIYSPMMSYHHGEGLMNPDRRDKTKSFDEVKGVEFTETIKVEDDGVFLTPQETGGVHYISMAISVGDAFFVSGEHNKKVSLQVMEMEGDWCSMAHWEEEFEHWDDREHEKHEEEHWEQVQQEVRQDTVEQIAHSIAEKGVDNNSEKKQTKNKVETVQGNSKAENMYAAKNSDKDASGNDSNDRSTNGRSSNDDDDVSAMAFDFDDLTPEQIAAFKEMLKQLDAMFPSAQAEEGLTSQQKAMIKKTIQSKQPGAQNVDIGGPEGFLGPEGLTTQQKAMIKKTSQARMDEQQGPQAQELTNAQKKAAQNAFQTFQRPPKKLSFPGF
jgi:hypothetical protein